jgi:hypothetical protein
MKKICTLLCFTMIMTMVISSCNKVDQSAQNNINNESIAIRTYAIPGVWPEWADTKIPEYPFGYLSKAYKDEYEQGFEIDLFDFKTEHFDTYNTTLIQHGWSLDSSSEDGYGNQSAYFSLNGDLLTFNIFVADATATINLYQKK